jgi:aminoglycoside 6'-N-acetyltransferase I
MRRELWPDINPAEDDLERARMLEQTERLPVFIALESDEAIGFAEARLRDYAEGCDTSPVGFLEGWYVREPWRRRGVGKALLAAVED